MYSFQLLNNKGERVIEGTSGHTYTDLARIHFYICYCEGKNFPDNWILEQKEEKEENPVSDFVALGEVRREVEEILKDDKADPFLRSVVKAARLLREDDEGE